MNKLAIINASLLLASTLGVRAATVLIDNSTQNGSFELAGGVAAAGKIATWDGSPDIDNWTVWSEISAASNDSGTEGTTGRASDGSRFAFMQSGNAVHNMTAYVAQVGDTFDYSFTMIDRGSGSGHDLTLDLVFDDGGTITQFNNGTALVQTNVDPGGLNDSVVFSGSYTVQSGDAIVGKTVGLGFRDAVNYPNFDEAFLRVVPEPSVALLGGLGVLGLIRRRRI